MNKKNIMILRHAEASAPTHGNDHGRTLNQNGRDQVISMANIIEKNEMGFDFALVSNAQRTRETFEILQKKFSWTFPSKISQSFYEASTQTYINEILETPEKYNNLLIIGHNPTLEELGTYLGQQNFHLSTCTALLFQGNSWHDVNWKYIKTISP